MFRLLPLCLSLALTLGAGWSMDSANTAVRPAPHTTREHLGENTWWPTKPYRDRAAYAGTAACARCHGELVRSQAISQMAHTLTTADRSEVLATERNLHWTAGDYRWSVVHDGSGWKTIVTDGKEQMEAPLEWAFGSGEVGQSYLWRAEQDGFGESRFNYFAGAHGLAATPGRLHGAPVSLPMALGRRVEPFEARTCFACHTTALSEREPLDLASAVPGVQCEACHGPGAAHVVVMDAEAKGAQLPRDTNGQVDLHIARGSRLAPVDAVDMCGSCHSTPADVELMDAKGVQTVRFPAYRLEKSRCWGTAGDARITCTACHDPHAPLERSATAYDHACLRCHARQGSPHLAPTAEGTADAKPGRACPVSTSRCASCHMPKFELPEMHSRFTDHWIRTLKPDGAFPD